MKKTTFEKVTLDLNQEIITFGKMRLEQFYEEHPATPEHPDDYAEIVCVIRELVVQLVRLIYFYLHKHNHRACYTKTGDITLLTRRCVYNYVNK